MRTSNYLRQGKRRGQNKEGTENAFWSDKINGKYQLTLALDINRAQLDNWIKLGMPVLKSGGINNQWEFDLSAVKAWAHAEGLLQISET